MSEFWCQCIKSFEQLQSIAVSLRNQGRTMHAHTHLHTAGNDVLKQTGVPNLAPKIVDVQPDQEMHAYFAKCTTVLGIVHIICGVVNIVAAAFITKAFNSVDDVDDSTEATATVTEATYERVWPSILFLASGVFSILAARKRSKCLGSVAQTLSCFSAGVYNNIIYINIIIII